MEGSTIAWRTLPLGLGVGLLGALVALGVSSMVRARRRAARRALIAADALQPAPGASA